MLIIQIDNGERRRLVKENIMEQNELVGLIVYCIMFCIHPFNLWLLEVVCGSLALPFPTCICICLVCEKASNKPNQTTTNNYSDWDPFSFINIVSFQITLFFSIPFSITIDFLSSSSSSYSFILSHNKYGLPSN